jgi:phosphohistidine phosphatase SixA
MIKFLFSIVYLIVICPDLYANENYITLKEFKNNSDNQIIFMRHSLAPGFGDPENFNLNDCSKQRNLDKRGIEQSKIVGNAFKENDIVFNKIFSSFWCRCKDTAFYLNIGDYNTHKGLNSFFEDHVDRGQTILELNKLIDSLKPHKGPYLMVTHYVVVQAISELSVSSGGMVVYDMISTKSKYLKISD